MVADIRAAQIFVERLHRFFAAHVAKDAVRFERLAAARRDAFQFELGVIAVGDGPAFDGNKVGGAVAQFFNGLIDVGVLDLEVLDFDFQVLILSQLEFGQDLERGAEFHRPCFREVHLIDLRLRHRHQLVFGDGALDLLGHERLQHFALDVVGKPAADQRDRRLPGPKSRDARHARKFLGHAFDGFLHGFRGDFQIQLAPASCFSHGHAFRIIRCNVIGSKYLANHPEVRVSTISLPLLGPENWKRERTASGDATKREYRGIDRPRQLARPKNFNR